MYQVELSHEDLAIDLEEKLHDTDTAIELLEEEHIEVPPEAFEIRGIIRRAIHAEQTSVYVIRLLARTLEPGALSVNDLVEFRQYLQEKLAAASEARSTK